MTRSYDTAEYWDKRYQFKDEQYEWYASYSSIRHLMTPPLLSPPDGVHTHKPRRTIQVRDRYGNMVPRSVVDLNRPPTIPSGRSFPSRDQCRVLILGCGNSRLSEDMMLDGWAGGIVNVDYSQVVIDQMKQRYNSEFYDKFRSSRTGTLNSTAPPMVFQCLDVTTTMPYPDESFDVIVVKGTLDAILCSSGSIANTERMMQECCRVLCSDHGAMVVVTNGSPDNHLVYFEKEGSEWWDGVAVHTIPRPPDKVQVTDAGKDYYVYIARKRPVALASQALVQRQLVAIDEENSPLSHKSLVSKATSDHGSVSNSSSRVPTSVASHARLSATLLC